MSGGGGGEVILAGDIGGTKTDLALFEAAGEGETLLREERFESRRYAGLEEIVERFLAVERLRINRACFGIAGPVTGDEVRTTNLPWVVSAKQMAAKFDLSVVTLLNDLEAAAHGLLVLPQRELEPLQTGEAAHGNRCIIAAGTGLGEAALFWGGRSHHPSASEGGHADFGPRTALEIELLQFLLARYERVSYERILSGPGLRLLYDFFKERSNDPEPGWLADRMAREDPAAVIVDVGLAGRAALCVNALQLFVEIYGAEAGNLALKYLATGGVYLGGGIAPKIMPALKDGRFVAAFAAKGRYAALMRRIPIAVIMNPRVALLGAARAARRRPMRDS